MDLVDSSDIRDSSGSTVSTGISAVEHELMASITFDAIKTLLCLDRTGISEQEFTQKISERKLPLGFSIILIMSQFTSNRTIQHSGLHILSHLADKNIDIPLLYESPEILAQAIDCLKEDREAVGYFLISLGSYHFLLSIIIQSQRLFITALFVTVFQFS